jgi:Flp pilus assembly pilin Flp
VLAAGEAGRLVARALCELMVRKTRGVTRTEYALILGIVAVLAYGTYRVPGSSVSSLTTGVDSALTTASRGASAAEATPKP